jgi:DUF1680 family protein
MRILLGLVVASMLASGQSDDSWKSQGILYLDHSPSAKLRDLPVSAVKMYDGFWAKRMEINADRSVPTMLQELEDHGVVNNFRRLAGHSSQATHQGPVYTDSDVYKWIEGAAFVLQSGDRPQLRKTIDALITDILAAQEPSGYLNTYYQGDKAALRFTEMHRSHELYCLGHLLQAAIAYYRATGDRKLLDGGIKYVDYLIANFGPDQDKHPLLTGHPELEMALVELYRTTGDRKDLDLAAYLFSGVEQQRLKLKESEMVYTFSGKPFTSRTQVEGHAVRAMYAMSGATDYYLETGDAAYWKTLNLLWSDLTSSKMYITGGVGSRAAGEAFGVAYELPNMQAYGESCAAIANLMFQWRLLMATADSRYGDVMERALYNGIDSGMSLDGTTYCYRNPLESAGEKIRNPWYDTTCCPPNLERTFAALPGYMYGVNEKGVYVNLFHASKMTWHLPSGSRMEIEQKTDYPWQGAVHFAVTMQETQPVSMFLRIPAWSTATRVMVNRKPWTGSPTPGQFYEIHRAWHAGDTIDLQLDMRTRLMTANPLLREDAGRVAVERGPLVYCLESADQPSLPSLFDVTLTGSPATFQTEYRPGLLGGLMVLQHSGLVTQKPLATEPLYREMLARQAPPKTTQLTFIPYYAWANRGPLPMEVWIPFQSKGSE